MPDQNEANEYKWAAIKITEVSAMLTLAALMCGLAHDGAFFSSLSPGLFGLLSIHDHINSAIGFLPSAISLTVATQFLGWVYQRFWRYDLLYMVSEPALSFLPAWRERALAWIRQKQAVDQERQDADERQKAEFPAQYEEDQEKVRKSKIIFSIRIAILTSLILIIGISILNGIWNAINVVVGFAWWASVVVTVGLTYKWKPHPGLALVVIMAPLIALNASLSGYIDAWALTDNKKQKVTLLITGRPSVDNSILARVIDGGVLLYDQSLRRLSYYPWAKVERVEVPRRN